MSEMRVPAVAGRFYPGDEHSLRAQVQRFIGAAGEGTPALGLMAPHAGYVYSGAVAGETFAQVKVPGRVIVLAPNHTGRGVRGSVWPGGAWRVPVGTVAVDEEVRDKLLGAAPLLEPDRRAHEHEHSLEVQLPFLLARNPAVRLTAITLSGIGRDECLALGRAIASVVRDLGGDILVCASSDMSHYISAREAAARDQLALDRMIALDPEGLYDVVEREDISMCGFMPATVMLAATVALGATTATVVRYASSGDVSGDFETVVGYAGVVVR
jgi:hypothetical protein